MHYKRYNVNQNYFHALQELNYYIITGITVDYLITYTDRSKICFISQYKEEKNRVLNKLLRKKKQKLN